MAALSRLLYETRQYRRGLPTVVSFDVTERCTLHCKMCRFWTDGDHDESAELDTKTLCRMIDEVVDDLGVRRIRFLGGEPFTRPDMLDIVRHAKSRGAHVNLVTEGTQIDQALAERIVDSGLDSIRFSIDGVGAAHDYVRGKRGTWDRAAAAMLYLKAAKVRRNSCNPEMQIFTVVSSLNFDQVEGIHRAAQEEFGPARYIFGPVWEATEELVTSSYWEGKPLADNHHVPFKRSLQLSPEQNEVFQQQVERIQGQKRHPLLAGIMMRVARVFLRGNQCPESNSLHVDPFGRVKFCSLYMNYAYGKYPESPVKEIWFSRRHRRFMQDIHREFLPVCQSVCGHVENYYVGNPRQLLRNVLLRVIPSPFRGESRGGKFAFEPPDEVVRPTPLARRPVRATFQPSPRHVGSIPSEPVAVPTVERIADVERRVDPALR